jgi:hypothetical protein
MFRATTLGGFDHGLCDMALDRPEGWLPPPFPMGQLQLSAALFGDDEAGPFAAMHYDPPRFSPMPVTPGHGHGSDSWRISIRGTLRMGARRYGEGAFRFQQGGAIYGADDVSWGPGGGCSFIMMADRRGGGTRTAYARDQAQFDETGKIFSAWLGHDVTGPFDAPQAVATTLGPARVGRVEGAFGDPWPQIAEGLRFAAGLAGEPERGPAVLLMQAAAGAVAFPAARLDSDIVHLVLRGAGAQDGDSLTPCQMRMIQAGRDSGAIRAGADGLWLATVIGDRRAVPEMPGDAGGPGAAMRAAVEGLRAGL